VAVAILGCIGCATGVLLWGRGDPLSPLALVLTACALFANIAAADMDSEGKVAIGGSFVASMLAVAFLGVTPAFFIAAVAEIGAWIYERYRPAVLPINVLASGGPNIAAALVLAAIAPANHLAAGFYVALGIAAVLALALNHLIGTALTAGLYGGRLVPGLRVFSGLAPAMAISVAMTIATAAIYVHLGLGGALFILISILAYTYMARLVVAARRRTRQYASLSWGVLSGLLRTLDLRDARAARHAAGVAAFSRDIAEAAGMSARDCELAHTAGLLHDIGRFGLSDRVMEKSRTLTEQDWATIRRHPELGADMLRDLGMYGPVAEIVRAHHERIDGRGYPDELKGDEIPELAKIVAVAETYDTLTADDTYRSPVSSFEALTELRRVSGTQLEGKYVEALAALLAGRGVEYRHANRADFDVELDVERRISDSVGMDEAAAQ
jgi:putative nucleotidyltransferase with HDIG domain